MLHNNYNSNYGTAKINRLHTEAKNARLARQVKTPLLHRAIAKSLTQIANRLDSEFEISFERKATA